MDLEMGGPNVDKYKIVEIACLVTEADLTILGQGRDIIISHPRSVIEGMSDWCLKTFAQNGLIERIRKSETTMKQAEDQVLDYVRQYTDAHVCPLGGNSVHTDRVFLEKYMPDLSQHLHYRSIDVSSIKEVVKRWFPDSFEKMPPKKGTHRAMDDIIESVAELKWYKENVFSHA